jgi:hypothetical protein
MAPVFAADPIAEFGLPAVRVQGQGDAADQRLGQAIGAGFLADDGQVPSLAGGDLCPGREDPVIRQRPLVGKRHPGEGLGHFPVVHEAMQRRRILGPERTEGEALRAQGGEIGRIPGRCGHGRRVPRGRVRRPGAGSGGLLSTPGEREGGGAERDRTADLVIANDALYQLSYSPLIGAKPTARVWGPAGRARCLCRGGKSSGGASMLVARPGRH